MAMKDSKDNMAKGREKSDGRVVPQDRRKAVVTGAKRRGGKAATASEQANQVEMFCETADSPKGADGEAEADRSDSGSRAVLKSQSTKPDGLPAVTMEEVASEQNLTNAFKKSRRTKVHRVQTGRASPKCESTSTKFYRRCAASCSTAATDREISAGCGFPSRAEGSGALAFRM